MMRSRRTDSRRVEPINHPPLFLNQIFLMKIPSHNNSLKNWISICLCLPLMLVLQGCEQAKEATPADSVSNVTKVFNEYKAQAERGDAKAQFNLGACYALGQGVATNYVEAVKWWRKAADQGYTAAQTRLGEMYAEGRGVPKDVSEANRLLRKAEYPGDTPASGVSSLPTSITTSDGKTYERVKVQRVGADWLLIEFRPEDGGIGLVKLKFAILPESLQKLYNYDPQKAAGRR
jgi:hypothetical protein